MRNHLLIDRRRAAAVMLCAAILLSACGTAATAVPTRSPMSTPAPTLPATTSTAPTEAASTRPIPILAYYYIWFDPTSWDKNKIDYPLLGKYSSSDPVVMRQHIQWAKAAGITGFLVSWKSTPTLNSRLDQLVKIAQDENFKLGIIYQGLDYNRNPIPVATVGNDLDYFIAHYADQPVFNIFGKPLFIWSGTWKFTTQEIASVSTQARRDKVLFLASDRDVAGIQRLKGLIDGDAYYFSSVNPDTFSNYQGKLNAMAQAVHDTHGLWIAPASPGFDARLIGGTTVVDRKNGDTLKTELNVAWQSSPDAVGLISWNEFSENSYIEPSEKYGKQDLDLLTTLVQNPLRGNAPAFGSAFSFDSSDPGTGTEGFALKIAAIGMVAALIVGGMIAIARRH
jgi:hypothetical protein